MSQDGAKPERRTGMLRSTAVFSVMTLLSRVAGYLRDWLQASLFGAGPAVSAFVVAYRIPNYLRRIFAEGSFSSAFVPVLSELKQKGDQEALQDFLDHIAGALLAVVVVVTGLGMLMAPWIARLFLLFADSSESDIVPLTAEMLRITFPYLTFISMTALAGAVLNTFRHFGLPALTPVLHNLGAAGLLDSHVEPSMSGPPRRYYQITEAGRAVLHEWITAWRATRDSVDTVLEGPDK